MANVKVFSNRYETESLYQWSINQILTIYGLSLPTVPEIHFTNDALNRAIVRSATMDNAGVITVKIPNSLLQSPYNITAYVCIEKGGAFESLYQIIIPIKARKKPADYTLEITDEEVYSFEAITKRVDDLDTRVSKVLIGDYSAEFAELTDIRVGVNGKVYASAGEAVRKQIESVANDVVSLEEKTDTSITEIYNAINGVEEELHMINDGGIE